MTTFCNPSTGKPHMFQLKPTSPSNNSPTNATIVKQLGSFNPGLSIKLQSEMELPENKNKRTNSFEREELDVAKKQKADIQNINMLGKYASNLLGTQPKTNFDLAQENLSLEEIQNLLSLYNAPSLKLQAPLLPQQDFLPINPSHLNALSGNPNLLLGAVPQSMALPPVAPASSWRQLLSSADSLSSLAAFENIAPSSMGNLGIYRQLLQAGEAVLGANPETFQSLYKDVQMLYKLKKEAQAMKDMEGAIPQASIKRNLSGPKIDNKPTMNFEINGQKLTKSASVEKKEVPVNQGAMTLGSGFNSFQSSKILQQQAETDKLNTQKVQKVSPKHIKPVNKEVQSFSPYLNMKSTQSVISPPKIVTNPLPNPSLAMAERGLLAMQGNIDERLSALEQLLFPEIQQSQNMNLRSTMTSEAAAHSKILALYFDAIKGMLGASTINEEKAFEVLVNFRYNFRKLVEDVKKNMMFYRYYLQADQQLLRNRFYST